MEKLHSCLAKCFGEVDTETLYSCLTKCFEKVDAEILYSCLTKRFEGVDREILHSCLAKCFENHQVDTETLGFRLAKSFENHQNDMEILGSHLAKYFENRLARMEKVDFCLNKIVRIPDRHFIAPATASWTLPFGAYLLLLSARVVSERAITEKSFASKAQNVGKTEFSSGLAKKGAEDPDPLSLADRCLGDYLATVPVAIIISLVAELNGANSRFLNYALGALLLVKVAHIELGLRNPGTNCIGGAIGYFGCQGWLAGMAGYCGYLSKDYWWP